MTNRADKEVETPGALEILQIGQESGIFKTYPALLMLLLAAMANPGDKGLLSLLWTRMQPPLLDRQMSGLSAFPNPPAGNEVAGPILLGVVEATGAPYGIHPDNLLRNTLVVGSTGSGKTNFIKVLLAELAQLR